MQTHAFFPKENAANGITFSIIGMGLSGNSLFCQLVDKLILENSSSTYHIKLFEKDRNTFATGLPYQINCPPIWTLNNPARNLKLTPNGKDVATWMQENRNKWQHLFPEIDEEYVPRALVGLYLRDQFELHKKIAKQHGIIIEEVIDEIEDISSIKDEQWQIKAVNEGIHKTDYLFLCLGHAPSDHFSYLKFQPNYFHSSFDIERLKDIPNNASLYILGGQATFVDIALWLAYVKHHTGTIYTITRNPAIITSKGNKDQCDKVAVESLKSELHSNYLPNSLSLSVGKLLFWQAYQKAVKEPLERIPTTQQALTYQLAKYHNQSFVDHSIGNIDELRSFIFTFYFSGCYQEFWKKLRDEDKLEFNNQLYTQCFAYLTGITPLNARLLLELYNKDLIKEQSGLTSVIYDESKQKFILHFKNENVIEADYLINASGLGYDISKCTNQPLLKNLVEKGFLAPKKWGGIEITDHGQAIDRNGHVQKNLICIGPTASFGHRYPTSYASFIAIDAVEKALKAIKIKSIPFSQHQICTLC